MTNPLLIGRSAPALEDELVTLTSILDCQRATVIRKVAELTDEQGRNRPVLPSTMTPMGLVKHLTAVERWWFSIDFAARDVPPPWPEDTEQSYDGFELSDIDTMAGVIESYIKECAASREVVAAARSLDQKAKQPPGQPFNLRYAILHMIEETARHNGHLDLMREAIDGSTGE